MDHLGHDRFHVAGYSLGAVVAAALAADAGDRVCSLTLLAGWVTTDARMRFTFDLWRRLIEADKELFVRYAIADGITAEGMALMESAIDVVVPATAATIAPGSGAQLDLDMVVDIADRLALITAPTLVLGGSEDRWVDIAHSRALARGIADATMVELPAGHLVIQERAADVARLLHDHTAAHR
jgi:pimeloyl-ACP methyl ester carboxylesterase